MTKPLYLLDLEGTTGIYTNSLHVNDTIQLRAGFRELIDEHNQGKKRIAITTRAPRYFVDVILENLQRNGINLDCRVYTKEDLQFSDTDLISYKDYSKVYSDHGVDNPCKDAVVLGDFLRFDRAHHFHALEYRKFKFSDDSSVLGKNHALNDHPFPENEDMTPVYAVVPQPWTTFSGFQRITLDMDFVMGFLDEMYKQGDSNFEEGFKKIRSNGLVEAVESDCLAKRKLNKKHNQKYLVLKGKNCNWKYLEEVM